MTSISACMILKEEPFWLRPCLKSLLCSGAIDEIVIVDGGSQRETLDVIDEFSDDRIRVFHRKWRGDYGDQRNYCLKQASGDFILQIDADEVLGDDGHELRRVADSGLADAYNVRMEHFIWHFGLVDATVDCHYGVRRFYRNIPGARYAGKMHELVDSPNFGRLAQTDKPTVFHCGYLKGVAPIFGKYEKNLKDSEVHTREFLKKWRDWHLLGTYPVRPFKEEQLPSVLKGLFV